jgi:hypothetical protein
MALLAFCLKGRHILSLLCLSMSMRYNWDGNVAILLIALLGSGYKIAEYLEIQATPISHEHTLTKHPLFAVIKGELGDTARLM